MPDWIKKSASKKKRAAPDGAKQCTACGEIGHSRRTHRDCPFYVPRKQKAQDDTPAAQTARDAAECEALDSMELVDSDGGEFFDARQSDSSLSGSEGVIVRGMI